MNNEILSNLTHYQSIKEVDSRPCTNVEYNQLLGQVSATMSLAEMGRKYQGARPCTDTPEEGYLVVYNLGKDNQFISWSPKKEFEEGYVEKQMVPRRVGVSGKKYWDLKAKQKADAIYEEVAKMMEGKSVSFPDLPRSFTTSDTQFLACFAPEGVAIEGWTISRVADIGWKYIGKPQLPVVGSEPQPLLVKIQFDIKTVQWYPASVDESSPIIDKSRPVSELDAVFLSQGLDSALFARPINKGFGRTLEEDLKHFEEVLRGERQLLASSEMTLNVTLGALANALEPHSAVIIEKWVIVGFGPGVMKWHEVQEMGNALPTQSCLVKIDFINHVMTIRKSPVW